MEHKTVEHPLKYGWITWLDNMAKRPLFDLLPHNVEFHYYSSVTPTELQSQTLGLGLKFRPSLKSPPAAQFESQIQDFCRSI